MNAEQIPENIFATACMPQLGRIDPPAFFSLTYPMLHAIAPVKTAISIALTTPAAVKNMAPCRIPKTMLCPALPAVNPILPDNLFRRNPLKSISSGRDVFKIAYTIIRGMAAAPDPANTDVAVSTLLTDFKTNTDKIKNATIVPSIQTMV